MLRLVEMMSLVVNTNSNALQENNNNVKFLCANVNEQYFCYEWPELRCLLLYFLCIQKYCISILQE